MAMSVFERRGEIATMRAIGWRRGRVARLIVGEAALLSMIGTILGIALGIAATITLAHWKRTSGLVQGDISVRAIVEGTCVAAAIALAGAAFPAWRCTKMPIAETMRTG
ncbi:MAG TPA: FtsX-like permease family protein, partial [Lacipirellulaceae bacterium]|nr:FtsX-like permease family protein [Lacipirellulaceae bacterium]